MPKGMSYGKGKTGMKPRKGSKMGAGMTPGSKPMKTVRAASVKATNSGLTFNPMAG